jgi:hypothetical protein
MVITFLSAAVWETLAARHEGDTEDRSNDEKENHKFHAFLFSKFQAESRSVDC